MSTEDVFSPDYETARRRFRAAATVAGARLEQLPIPARGPAGEELTIDVAWRGPARPRRVLLHTAGLHGVEGFAGSAIQLRLLTRPAPTAPDTAVVFLHILNPYGMAWLRRFNENNVDLNRNFLARGEEFHGAAEAYRQLQNLLNPTTPPRRLDFFLPRAAASIARYGYGALKQAIAEGQYEFPHGLFYGGRQLEATTVITLDWVKARLAPAERAVVIDIHTGLGPWGEDSLLTHYSADSAIAQVLRARLGPRVQTWTKTGVAYRIRGGFLDALERELRQSNVTSICQEFGAYRPVPTISALRQENRLHHWGDAHDLDHPAKRRLLEVFCPRDSGWRRKVLARGEELFATALAELL